MFLFNNLPLEKNRNLMLNSILMYSTSVLALQSINILNSGLISYLLLSSTILILIYFAVKYNQLNKDRIKLKITLASKKKEIAKLKKKITDRTRNLEIALQKAEESNRLKSLFLANMSHEIRTPLNGIMGFSELIIEDNIDDSSKKLFANQISQNGQNLLNLIDQIFHLSIIETGKVSLNKVEFNINDVIDIIKPKIEQAILNSNKKIKLSINIEDTHYTIKTDMSKFELILENLFDNAIKFTTQGLIEFTCLRLENEYLFQLTDSGCGLQEDEYEIIFDPFTQGKETLKKIKGGSGLGLSNVKNYVILLGGKIWCEKNKPSGSIFSFTLPAKRIKSNKLFAITNYSLYQN